MLELGAGAGLASLVAAILGAQKVVVTDYPDRDLISNIEHNIASCPLIPDHASIISALVGSVQAVYLQRPREI